MRTNTQLLCALVFLVALKIPSIGLSIESGFYSSYWTKWGIRTSQKDNIFIYQSPYPPDRETITKLAEESCTKNITIVFRQELDDRTRSNISFDQNEIALRSKAIANAYNFNCQLPQITLDEENVFWDERSEHLTDFYFNIKQNNPNIKIMQWYSGSKKNNAPGQGKWPKIPADGWVFDQYEMTNEVYLEYVTTITSNHTDLLSVMWLSPQWNIRTKEVDNHYWNEEGKKLLADRLNINIKNNIDAIFFSFYKSKNGKLYPLIDIANSENVTPSDVSCADIFLRDFKTKATPKLKSNILLTPDDIPDWCSEG